MGECPHCGAQSCGNACESCGRPNDCGDLKNPRCTICLSECETRPCERLYFLLWRHTNALRQFVTNTNMNWHLRALSHDMIVTGLPEIAVSHPAEWGITFLSKILRVIESTSGLKWLLATSP